MWLKWFKWLFFCMGKTHKLQMLGCPSFRPQFKSALAFKSIQMTYSLKPLHP